MDDQPKAFERDLRSILNCESGSVPPRRSRVLLFVVGPASLVLAVVIAALVAKPSFTPPAQERQREAQIAVAAPGAAQRPILQPAMPSNRPAAPARIAMPAARTVIAPRALAEREPAPRPRRRVAPAAAANVQNVSAPGPARSAMANPTTNERETQGSASHDQNPMEVAQIAVEKRQAAARLDALDALRELRLR